MNLEFGVGAGSSGNILAETIPKEKIWGFDSFNGFYEILESSLWYKVNKTFNKVKPTMRNNYEIIEGYIENTLEDFVKKLILILMMLFLFTLIWISMNQQKKCYRLF